METTDTSTTTSKQFSLNFKDIAKAALVAVLTPVLVLVQQSIDAGQLTFDWKHLSMAAIGGGCAYLIKNFLTPSQTVTTPPKTN